METLKERIARLEDEIIQAFNDRDKPALIEAQWNLRQALNEKERELDLKVAQCFMAARNLTHPNLN